ncbi:SDR family oxidoreductase [Amorphus sp. 3PC139-8]|uniref:SDR family oxidoreductase n=1 Tax=Amorphus sp. 3PC139-8 TaxID=2735676 RepID=UPI00345CCA5D
MLDNKPAQSQDRQPGLEGDMRPEPETAPRHPGSERLEGKVAIITGGDSGIGRAVAHAFAREGAHVAIAYLDEHDDAEATLEAIYSEGRNGFAIAGDLGDVQHCHEVVNQTLSEFDRIDILINNAAEQHEVADLVELSPEQLERTFRTNVFSYFYMTKAVLPHLKSGSAIVNTTSVTAYQGHPTLLDYSATKGAIASFTRTMSMQLVERGIRVNGVAPGPIWTPLIPASFDAKHTAKHGEGTPMARVGQPNEVAPSYVFLASDDGSYMSGQILHPNGGTLVGS